MIKKINKYKYKTNTKKFVEKNCKRNNFRSINVNMANNFWLFCVPIMNKNEI